MPEGSGAGATEIQKIVFDGEEFDGSYSMYVIPILSNGTRLNPIYIPYLR